MKDNKNKVSLITREKEENTRPLQVKVFRLFMFFAWAVALVPVLYAFGKLYATNDIKTNAFFIVYISLWVFGGMKIFKGVFSSFN